MDRVPKNGLGVPGAFKKRGKSSNKNPTQITSKNITKRKTLTVSVLALGEVVLTAVAGAVAGTFWFGPGPDPLGPFFGEVTT